MKNAQKIDYSIVIPVFCNQGTLKKTHKVIQDEIIQYNKSKSYELIFIDDGSYDSSFEELMQLKKQYPENIKIIKFTRNFGQISAILAGYQYTRGKCIINISADLQEPPELVNEMLNYHYKDNYDIVIGTRDSRDESFFRSKTSNIFYRIIKKLIFPNMPKGGFDSVLISDKVKKVVLNENDSNPFWQGQILWTGYKIKFIPYKRKKREVGKSKWTFSKKLKYLIDGVMSYSYFPLRAMSITGLIISLLGFIYAVVILFARIFGKVQIYGWTPIMILILVLSGIQMLMIGVIGEYLWRTLEQVRNRQKYIIEEIYD